MVTIPLELRTVAGLDKKESKALVFIVQEWRRLKEKHERAAFLSLQAVDTNDVTKHLKTKHPETMKILNRFRQQGLVRLETRNSAGPSGNGWDGALFGALTPSQFAIKLVDQYFSES